MSESRRSPHNANHLTDNRICSIAYCISLFLVKLTIIVDTEQIEILKFAIWWAASASTSLLFFFRVSAVYKHSRPIRFLFSLLWIIIIVSPTAIIYSLRTQCESAIYLSLVPHTDTNLRHERPRTPRYRLQLLQIPQPHRQWHHLHQRHPRFRPRLVSSLQQLGHPVPRELDSQDRAIPARQRAIQHIPVCAAERSAVLRVSSPSFRRLVPWSLMEMDLAELPSAFSCHRPSPTP